MPAGSSLSYRQSSLSCPPAPLCHARRLLAGIQHLALLFFYSCGPCMGKAMDSRLTMSGMTEGGLTTWGMTEGLLCLFVMPRHPLTPALSRKGEGAGCASVMPAGSPLSFPPVSPITNVGDKVSGNPVSCFVVLLFVWGCMGEAMDSRLPTSGMTEEDYQPSIETVEGRLWE